MLNNKTKKKISIKKIDKKKFESAGLTRQLMT